MKTTSEVVCGKRSYVIDIEGVHFAYGKTDVLNGLELRIQRGEIVALLGSNGAGKTTLVENIIGSLAPNRGRIRVLGQNPKNANSDFWCQVGLVQQHWSDHPKWRVKDQLQWLKASYATASRPTKDVDDALQEVGLLEKKNTTLGKLSGGQRRRVDFACSLLADPALLVLDEPTTGLDPLAKSEIHDLVSAIADRGNTVLFTTHDLAEAEKLASRVLILAGGKIAADGSPRQLRNQLVGKAQVTWHQDGVEHVHATDQVEQFLTTLDLERISGLTVTRPTLEDAYVAMIKAGQAGGTQ
ncbi:MAG: ABC transporter ATP-binding protein [Actinomycetaceae bacterium]|nr:ABC transporter ATP-binding protein [Actinomycetaceae bacterium]